MLLKKLTEANGLPNNETNVRKIIIEEIKNHVDSFFIDNMGNIIAVKNEKVKGKHVALAAHMDEVGLVVKWIEDSGLIRFASWGCDSRILPAKHVKIGDTGINGVIGTKPIHLQKASERDTAIDIDDMYVDIGAKNKEDAKKHVKLGDYIAFCSDYTPFGNHKIKAKALDDRVGCSLIIEILKSDIPYKITACFNAQEEVGLRGSAVSANIVKADLVINLEGTISADVCDIEPHMAVTTCGGGPAISLIDGTSIYLKSYVTQITDVAKKHGINHQLRRTGMGGTDAGNYHTAGEGVPVIGLSIPCKYIHSPVSVMDMDDYKNALKLLDIYIKEFNEC